MSLVFLLDVKFLQGCQFLVQGCQFQCFGDLQKIYELQSKMRTTPTQENKKTKIMQKTNEPMFNHFAGGVQSCTEYSALVLK